MPWPVRRYGTCTSHHLDWIDNDKNIQPATRWEENPVEKIIKQLPGRLAWSGIFALLVATTATAQIVEDANLLASDGASGDVFGSGIAISKNTVVVGARYDDDNGINSGSVYIYQRDGWHGQSWTEQAKLVASDGEAGDRFGDFVALDQNTALIGSPGDPYKLNSAGAAYVFTYAHGTWTEQAKLVANDGESGDEFGQVALDGNTAVISAQSDDDNGFDSGSVYVFKRSRGTWTEQAKLLASDGMKGDQFGRIAIDDKTIVVGASNVDDGKHGLDTGSAYIFTLQDGTWTEQAKLTASDAAAGDNFGWSVAIDGDTAVIGAIGADQKGNNSGAAYVFTRNNGVWTEQAKLTARDGAANDGFGRVAIDGRKILVSAPRNGDQGSRPAAAYIFTLSNGSWIEQTKVLTGFGATSDGFGVPAMAGKTFVVGAGSNQDDGKQLGSAYVFSLTDAEFDGIIDERDNCPTEFNPDQLDSNGDGFGDACVDPSVMVSANVDVDRTVTVGADAKIKRDVRVGANTSVGSKVYLKRGVYVGEDVIIGDGARLNKDSEIGDSASIGPGVTMGRNVFVGPGTVIGANTVIGKDTVICGAAEIGPNSEIGKNNFVSELTILSPASVHGEIEGPAPDPADCGQTMSMLR